LARQKTATMEAQEPTEGVHRGLALYRQMLLIRGFEDTVQDLFLKGEVHGTTHLYSGQEASAVGVASAIRDGDRVAATYRGHGAALALGVSPQGLLDELLGRESGVCGGRAGSMNVVDLEHGLIGCFGIVGGSIGAATGAALAFKQRGNEAVAVTFFGEGTSNQAYFHECLNFAQVAELPVVFVCENNLYMEFTPIEEVTAGAIADRPRAMGITTEIVDGNDVWTVQEAARRSVDHARAGQGPAFLETLTYRFVGHSRSDPGKYRKPGELEAWKKRDPLLVAERKLSEDHGVAETALKQVRDEINSELESIVASALAAPMPSSIESASEFK
jgi:TPP-dependent pyruvate/acetoin dehydrogenase alpha subunit